MPAGAQHPGHFRQRTGPGFHVAQAKGHRQHVERAIGERQPQPVGHHELPEPFALRHPQHRQTEIRPHHQRIRARHPQRQRQVATARRQIEHAPRLPRPDDPRRPATPQEIQPEAEKMIRKIIARGNGREQRAHERPLGLLCSHQKAACNSDKFTPKGIPCAD